MAHDACSIARQRVGADDGGPLTIISNTNAATFQAAMPYTAVLPTSGAHTITVKNLGTTGHPRVDIDAFVVLS